MAEPESVQYFQFDKDGNMFVNEPGAGCSGQCVKVDPGFDEDFTRSLFTECTVSSKNLVKSEIAEKSVVGCQEFGTLSNNVKEEKISGHR